MKPCFCSAWEKWKKIYSAINSLSNQQGKTTNILQQTEEAWKVMGMNCWGPFGGHGLHRKNSVRP